MPEFRIGGGADRIEDLGEETPGCGGQGDVEDLDIAQPMPAEPVDILGRDRRRVTRHLLGEVHDGQLGLVEPGCGPVTTISLTVSAS